MAEVFKGFQTDCSSVKSRQPIIIHGYRFITSQVMERQGKAQGEKNCEHKCRNDKPDFAPFSSRQNTRSLCESDYEPFSFYNK